MMIGSRHPVLLFVLWVLFVAVHTQAATNETLYVSPNGNDAWSGRLANPAADGNDGPLRTLAAARDRIRGLKSNDSDTGAVYVYLRGGTYTLDEAFELGPQDSGTENAPVLYSAWQHETVCLIGGKEVRGFTPVTDPNVLQRLDTDARDHIRQVDLTALGITDFGELTSRGFGRPIRPAGLELFFDDQRMTLARWPNTGWIKIAAVPNGQDGGQFTYAEETPGNWAQSDDIWVHGFWTQDWADSYEHVKSIDPATQTIQTHPPHGVYGYTENQRFFF